MLQYYWPLAGEGGILYTPSRSRVPEGLVYFLTKVIEASYLEFLTTFAFYFNIIKRNYYLSKLLFSTMIKKLSTLSFSIESTYLSCWGWVFIKGSSNDTTAQTNYENTENKDENNSGNLGQYSPEEPEDPKNEDSLRLRLSKEDDSQLKSPIYPHPDSPPRKNIW